MQVSSCGGHLKSSLDPYAVRSRHEVRQIWSPLRSRFCARALRRRDSFIIGICLTSPWASCPMAEGIGHIYLQLPSPVREAGSFMSVITKRLLQRATTATEECIFRPSNGPTGAIENLQRDSHH
jgi:hypothetical protein